MNPQNGPNIGENRKTLGQPDAAVQRGGRIMFITKYLSRLLHDSFCFSASVLNTPLYTDRVLPGQEAYIIMMFFQNRFVPWTFQLGDNDKLYETLEEKISLELINDDDYTNYLAEIDGFIIAFICCPNRFDETGDSYRENVASRYSDAAVAIMEYMEKTYGVYIGCLISDFVNSVTDFHHAYDALYRSWEYIKFFQQTRGISLPAWISHDKYDISDTYHYCLKASAELCSLIKHKDIKKTCDYALEVLEHLADEKPLTLTAFRLRIQTWVTNIRSALIISNIISLPSREDDVLISEVVNSRDYAELQNYMKKWVEYICETYSKTKSSQTIGEIIQFIDDNIRMPWLSVRAISEKFHISPSNLSTQFRNKTGERPIDYIQKSRINLAVKLLSSSNLLVRDVCSKVGFGSVETMNRAFRKYRGRTPTMFRNKNVGL